MNTAKFHRRLVELGRRRGQIPRYGSPEWEALPTGDARVFAAVVIAAENWRRDGTDEAIAARLRRELEEADQLVLARQFEAAQDVHGAWMDLPPRQRRVGGFGMPRTPEGWIAYWERCAERIQQEMQQRREERAAA
ncbi:MAG TPA: hypothetical protein VIP77_15445 [Jiangellaceae bacterium]